MMSGMRTTLTLDEDVAKQLHEIARKKGESFKEVVNSTLRKGLNGEKAGARLPKFKVTPKACGFRSGVDVLRLNQLNDELEIEDFQRKLARTGRE
jgi:ribosomal protein L4